MSREEYLKQAVRKYGTPLYVLESDVLNQTAELFRKELKGRADLCFAMKANPFMTGRMAAIADRIEVCSMGEFRICRAMNIAGEKILISGVLKKEQDLLEILEYYGNTCRYTVESPEQFFLFCLWCRKHRIPLFVYLRLTSGNQFGMDEDQVRSILAMQSTFPYLNICGIHYFSGTQKRKTAVIEKELMKLDQFLLSLQQETGTVIKELEYGPGLAVSYFNGEEEHLDQDVRELAGFLDAMHWKGRITLEMGRALTADCGCYLTAVEDIKTNNGKNYCITDGGIHQINYDGQIKGMYQPKLQVLTERETKAEEEKDWCICGSLCTVNDVLVQKIRLKDLKKKDVLVFEKTGAYAMTEGMALFLSHELPGIVLYSQRDGLKPVRRQTETYEWNMGK